MSAGRERLPYSRAVVTGGAGFIGSHLVDLLVGEGVEVLVVDDLSSGDRAFVNEEAKLVVVDVRDRDGLARAFRDAKPDVVFHLAAHIDVTESVANPAHDCAVNVLGTVHALEAAEAAGAAAFVLASSAAVYGEPTRVPVAEDAPLLPVAPYGVAKKAAEEYVRVVCARAGMRGVSLRLANVFGPRQKRRAGGGVVPILVEECLRGGTVTLFGHGKMRRDFVYVRDVARAFVAAGARGDGAFNVSTGAAIALDDLFAAVRKRTGGGEAALAPARDGEILDIALDPSRAKGGLGWEPATPFGFALDETVAYYRDTLGF